MTYITTIDKAIPYHPFANVFPLMEGAEFKEFVADIEKTSGPREPITLYQGMILEGRNRYRACLGLKIKPKFKQFKGDDEAAKAFVISANIMRRHLTPKQRHDLLMKVVAAQPNKSDRAIAREAKVDHHQVARARKKAEATGTTVPVEKRVGADGKVRKQPSHKPRPPTADDFHKQMAAKRDAAVAPKPANPVAGDAPNEELALLREFARFVIGRTRVKADPGPDHTEWKALLDKVKATLGIVS